jgi:hypothetical protein
MKRFAAAPLGPPACIPAQRLHAMLHNSFASLRRETRSTFIRQMRLKKNGAGFNPWRDRNDFATRELETGATRSNFQLEERH